MLDEAFGMLYLNILRVFLFHVDILDNPNELWLRLEAFFGNTDEMRGHQLKNELISLSPSQYETIQDFFTKLKSLVLQLKQCGIDNKEDNIILSILLKLGREYSLFVRTFHSSKLTAHNWCIHALAAFME